MSLFRTLGTVNVQHSDGQAKPAPYLITPHGNVMDWLKVKVKTGLTSHCFRQLDGRTVGQSQLLPWAHAESVSPLTQSSPHLPVGSTSQLVSPLGPSVSQESVYTQLVNTPLAHSLTVR